MSPTDAEFRSLALAYAVQCAAFVVVVVALFAWHRSAVLANHDAILKIERRSEAKLDAHMAYIKERDRRWASALGWPEPPRGE